MTKTYTKPTATVLGQITDLTQGNNNSASRIKWDKDDRG